jgi:hypothetical protein
MLSRARRSLNQPLASAPAKGPKRSLKQPIMAAPKQPPAAPKGFTPGQGPKAAPLARGKAANPILSGKKITPMVRSARPAPFKAPMPAPAAQGPALGAPGLARAKAALGGQKAKSGAALGTAGPSGVANDQDPTY